MLIVNLLSFIALLSSFYIDNYISNYISLIFVIKYINLRDFDKKVMRFVFLHRKLKASYLLMKLTLLILYLCHLAAVSFYIAGIYVNYHPNLKVGNNPW